jgi:hypothetical protein
MYKTRTLFSMVFFILGSIVTTADKQSAFAQGGVVCIGDQCSGPFSSTMGCDEFRGPLRANIKAALQVLADRVCKGHDTFSPPRVTAGGTCGQAIADVTCGGGSPPQAR